MSARLPARPSPLARFVPSAQTRVDMLRIAFALLFLYQTWRALPQIDVANRFHQAILPEVLVPSRAVAIALLGLRALAALLLLANVRALQMCALSSICLLHQLLCDRLDYHNNRYALALYGLALLPALFAAAEKRRQAERPSGSERIHQDLWPIRMQCALIYLCSGGSKLLDADWRSGRVIAERISMFGGEAVARGAPAKLVSFLGMPSVSALLAAGAIGLELSLVGLPFFTRARRYALVAGLLFHATIEATAKVEGFSLLTIAAYLAFFSLERTPSAVAPGLAPAIAEEPSEVPQKIG